MIVSKYLIRGLRWASMAFTCAAESMIEDAKEKVARDNAKGLDIVIRSQGLVSSNVKRRDERKREAKRSYLRDMERADKACEKVNNTIDRATKRALSTAEKRLAKSQKRLDTLASE